MNKGARLIFGLTADPPHLGHEQVIINSYHFMRSAQQAIAQFDLVPSYHAHLIAGKKGPQASFQQRMLMCQIIARRLIQQHGFNIHVSAVEKELHHQNGGQNYTIDTLDAIESNHKFFVLSADHFAGRWPKFRKWYQWKNLVKNNGLLIHQRPGHRINKRFIDQLKQLNKNIHIVIGHKDVAISSTQLRQDFKSQQHHVSDDIRAYIEQEKLY